MTDDQVTKKDPIEIVQTAVNNHGNSKKELIPILNEVNKQFGYLSREAMAKISDLLQLPESHVLSVASFYHMLSTKPMGKHVIKVCESAPCHITGGNLIIQTITENLDIKPDETSLDDKWTLITTSCLGVCGVGPVMMINDDIYGNVEPDQIPQILSRYE